jgi:hypothetical protein
MPESTASLPIDNTPEQTPETTEPSRLRKLLLGTSAEGFIARMTLLPLILYLLIFAFGFGWAWFFSDDAANYFAYLRNLLEMVLALAAIIIFVATGIFLVQIARFVNLLRSEIKPIAEDTKAAVKNIRITTEFVQKHGIAPIIRIQSFLVGLLTFLNEIIHISRILQQRPNRDSDADEISNEKAEELDEDE